MDFSAEKCVVCVVTLACFVSVYYQLWGIYTWYIIYDVILALRRQIFEYSRETFCRSALEYLQSARSEKKEKENAVFLRKRLTIFDLFEGLWSVGTRFRR